MVAFQRLETCREPEKFAGWLMQIVRSRALNRLEQMRVRSQTDLGQRDEAAPAGAETFGIRRQLLEALEKVSAIQREVVLLHDLESWTHPEIAESLGISEGMSRQHLFQARKILRVLLAETSAEPEARRAN